MPPSVSGISSEFNLQVAARCGAKSKRRLDRLISAKRRESLTGRALFLLSPGLVQSIIPSAVFWASP